MYKISTEIFSVNLRIRSMDAAKEDYECLFCCETVCGTEGFRCSACTCTPWHEACAPSLDVCPVCSQNTVVPWMGKLKEDAARFEATGVNMQEGLQSSDVLMPLGPAFKHDPGGKLLKLGQKASAMYLKAQFLAEPEKTKKIRYCIKLRLQERHGWLTARSSEFPAGDMEGVASASLAIACYHLEVDEFHQCSEWMTKARDEAPKDTIVHQTVLHNIALLQEQGFKF